MRLTVNRANIVNFVNDMISRALAPRSRTSQTASSPGAQNQRVLTNSDLCICSTILQVCVSNEYRNLMMMNSAGGRSDLNNPKTDLQSKESAAEVQDQRIAWFVSDVLFPLAHILQMK